MKKKISVIKLILFVLILTAWQVSTFSASPVRHTSEFLLDDEIGVLSLDLQARNIPKATKKCTPEEAKWWEEIRGAIYDTIRAEDKLEDAVQNAFRHGGIHRTDNDEELLSVKEREKLRSAITNARGKYENLLRTGQANNYHPPVDDQKLMIFTAPRPSYSEKARKNKVVGRVVISWVFGKDGTIGSGQIRRGLGFGLDENAVRACKDIVFLPAIKNGEFVDFVQTVSVSFSLL